MDRCGGPITIKDVAIKRVGLLSTAVACAAISVFSGCASSNSSGPDDSTLSKAARAGKAVAADSGCVACHSADGSTGVGPSWKGLAGSTVKLSSGKSVLADDEYLKRSISSPDKDKVNGFSVAMPTNALSASEIDSVVAYIKELK